MFNGRYVFYSETFKLQLSSINLHNFSSSLFRSLETCPSRSCLNSKTNYIIQAAHRYPKEAKIITNSFSNKSTEKLFKPNV